MDDDERWVKGTYSVYTIDCSVLPYKDGKESKILPDGVKTGEAFVVRSPDFNLIPTDDDSEQEGDIAIIGGKEYECLFVEDWSSVGRAASHYKGIFVKKDRK